MQEIRVIQETHNEGDLNKAQSILRLNMSAFETATHLRVLQELTVQNTFYSANKSFSDKIM